MNLNEFLVWLSIGGGGSVAASWILEQFSWFQALTVRAKQLSFFGVCLLLSLGSWAIQTYVPADVLAQLAPIFTIVAGSFTAVFAGTGFHKLNKPKAEEGKG